jgi:hypothetical protein
MPSQRLRRIATLSRQGGIARNDNVKVFNAFVLDLMYHFSLFKNEFQKPKKLKESP